MLKSEVILFSSLLVRNYCWEKKHTFSQSRQKQHVWVKLFSFHCYPHLNTVNSTHYHYVFMWKVSGLSFSAEFMKLRSQAKKVLVKTPYLVGSADPRKIWSVLVLWLNLWHHNLLCLPPLCSYISVTFWYIGFSGYCKCSCLYGVALQAPVKTDWQLHKLRWKERGGSLRVFGVTFCTTAIPVCGIICVWSPDPCY